MKNASLEFPYRIALFLFFLVLSYGAPWWAIFFPSLVAACLYRNYFEFIFFAFLIDLLSGPTSAIPLTLFSTIFHVYFILTISSLILYPIAYKIQKRSRFS